MARVVDPVCGMCLESAAAAATYEFEGQTYYFCSEACQRSLVANPRGHARPSEPKAGSTSPFEPERHEPPFTTTGKKFTMPKFGSAGSGGAEYEPLPEAHEDDDRQ
jgi:YHS domain-containing protein